MPTYTNDFDASTQLDGTTDDKGFFNYNSVALSPADAIHIRRITFFTGDPAGAVDPANSHPLDVRLVGPAPGMHVQLFSSSCAVSVSIEDVEVPTDDNGNPWPLVFLAPPRTASSYVYVEYELPGADSDCWPAAPSSLVTIWGA